MTSLNSKLCKLALAFLLPSSSGFAQQVEDTCVKGVQPSEVHIKAITAVKNIEMNAFATGDIDRMHSIVTEDIVWNGLSYPVSRGVEASASLQELMYAESTYEATYEPEEIVVEGNLAFDHGLWYEKATNKTTGKYREGVFGTLQIYYRGDDGCWRLARSVWNQKSKTLWTEPS